MATKKKKLVKLTTPGRMSVRIPQALLAALESEAPDAGTGLALVVAAQVGLATADGRKSFRTALQSARAARFGEI